MGENQGNGIWPADRSATKGGQGIVADHSASILLATRRRRKYTGLVRVISKRGLWLRAAKFADAKIALRVWMETAEFAHWSSLQDVRLSFPATDMIGNLAVFNTKGNRYRLIVRMEFGAQRIYIKEFLTHAEYDKGAWKKWL